MSKKLDFSLLEDKDQEDPYMDDARRWPSRNPNETVQMSLRMPRETYQRFRALCKRERRTNGDQLRVLMEGYLSREEASSK